MSDTQPPASFLFEPLATGNSARDLDHDVNSPRRSPRFPGSALEKYGSDGEKACRQHRKRFRRAADGIPRRLRTERRAVLAVADAAGLTAQWLMNVIESLPGWFKSTPPGSPKTVICPAKI